MTAATLGLQLGELESKDRLRAAGLPVVETRLARAADDAARLADAMGYPVVLKVASADIVHKSDVGGVRLGISGPAEVRAAYTEICRAAQSAVPNATIDGVTVQPMAPPGVELIVGLQTDAQFGPVVMFGLGGTLVEIIGDVTFGVVPLTSDDCAEMVRSIKGFPLLAGYRGHAGANIEQIASLLAAVSQFVVDNPEIEQLDLNPVIAYPDRNLIVDARMTVHGHESNQNQGDSNG